LAGTVPDPPAVLHITTATWEAGVALHRVHLDVYAAEAFNPGVKGNAKFSPIVNAPRTTLQIPPPVDTQTPPGRTCWDY